MIENDFILVIGPTDTKTDGKKLTEIDRGRIGTDDADDEGPMASEQIARVLSAMGRNQPLEILGDVLAELDAWDGKRKRHAIDHADTDSEDVVR